MSSAAVFQSRLDVRTVGLDQVYHAAIATLRQVLVATQIYRKVVL
jgi:hypothetical protein